MRDRAGRFIVFEGPDGGGKTTQVARTLDWLEATGREVVACRDPGGTSLGDHLRPLLKERSAITIGMTAEMLLFMASRAQLIEEVVRPALDRGAIVVGDRYLLSNVVYQGIAGGLNVADLWNVGRAATAGLLPDLTLVMDVPVAVALDRIGPGRDRIEDRGVAYRDQVRQGFLDAGGNLSRTDRGGGWVASHRRGDPDHSIRGGACPGYRSAVMIGWSSRSSARCAVVGCRMPSCSSVPRGSAS